MFGIHAVNVVIGLIFIYLLYSLFVSIINEMISRLFNKRGKHLLESLESLIGEKGVEALFEDPRIRVLIRAKTDVKKVKYAYSELKEMKVPDYIPEELFGEVIAEISNDKLEGFFETVDTKLKDTKDEVVKIFETSLLKTREVYRQNTRKWVFIIGCIVTVAFNVDTISIFNQLAENPELAAQIADQAATYVAANDSLQVFSESEIEDLKEDMLAIHESQMAQLESGLGIGLNSIEWNGWKDTVLSVLGWLITALALSLGAPFWFDLLRKVINIKNELKGKPASNANAPSSSN